jgi:transcriptional regulator with XRE-family HTH domain
MAKKRISKQLREAIERSGKTRYRIHKETGIAESQLSRFVNDPSVSLSLKNIDKLCECIGAELVLKGEHSERRRSVRRDSKQQ